MHGVRLKLGCSRSSLDEWGGSDLMHKRFGPLTQRIKAPKPVALANPLTRAL